jgi:hypothetical protein
MEDPLRRKLTITKLNQTGEEVEHSNNIFKSGTWGSLIWSLSIFLFNIYTIFLTIYWISIAEMPSEATVYAELAFEYFLLADLIIRVILHLISKKQYDRLKLIHTSKEDNWKIFLITFVGSFPMLTLYLGIGNTSETTQAIFSRLLSFKLLRSFEVLRAISKTEDVLFYKKFTTLVHVKFLKNVMTVLLLTHITVCGWLLIQETHGDSNGLYAKHVRNAYTNSNRNKLRINL